MSFEYFEEFPLLLLARFTEITGKPIRSFVVVNYQYNSEYSGAGSNFFVFIIETFYKLKTIIFF